MLAKMSEGGNILINFSEINNIDISYIIEYNITLPFISLFSHWLFAKIILTTCVSGQLSHDNPQVCSALYWQDFVLSCKLMKLPHMYDSKDEFE